jgi:putative transposase
VEKKELVERDNKTIAVARQCELLRLSRSSYYYGSSRDEYNLELMRLLDEQYTKVPFYGVRRLTAWLRAHGYIVNPKRGRVLMRRMGLQAIYPHKRRSFSSPGLNKKGYYFQQPEEATTGLGISHALRGIFWTYSQQKVC